MTKTAYQRLKAFGFEPRVVYDIGANCGDWTREMRGRWPEAEYHLFEANKNLCTTLESSGEKTHHCVLADENTLVQFYRGEKFTTGSSLFAENTNVDFRKELVLTETLHDVMWRDSVPLPDFIKLDTQGSELLILKGGQKAAEHAEIIQVECALHQYNAGAPLLDESIAYMRSIGFVAFDLVGAYGDKDGLPFHVDFLFCRPESKWIRREFR